MFSEELAIVLYYVVRSWYVLGVTLVLILYLSFISYVARSYRRPRFVSRSKPRKSKRAAVAAGPKEADDSEDTNKALGLEEG